MLVSLIGTVHNDSGLSNATELHKILKRIEPEVVFAEIPSSKCPDYINGSHGTLESRAVAIYLEDRSIDVVPVDLDEPSDEFFRDAKEMFGKVERTSPRYRQLVDRHTLDTKSSGFTYLNSERCVQALTLIHKETRETLDWIGGQHLKEIYEHWRKVNDLREKAMLENIYRYCDGSSLCRGALLVGTAHRRALMDKILQSIGKDANRLTWDFEVPCD